MKKSLEKFLDVLDLGWASTMFRKDFWNLISWPEILPTPEILTPEIFPTPVGLKSPKHLMNKMLTSVYGPQTHSKSGSFFALVLKLTHFEFLLQFIQKIACYSIN